MNTITENQYTRPCNPNTRVFVHIGPGAGIRARAAMRAAANPNNCFLFDWPMTAAAIGHDSTSPLGTLVALKMQDVGIRRAISLKEQVTVYIADPLATKERIARYRRSGYRIVKSWVAKP